MYENNLSDLPPTTEPSKLWLWAGIAIAGYYLFKDNKKKPKAEYEYIEEPSMTPSDLHGLSGSLRTCDAWFQTVDKRGKSVNRCFIYKPACNTKKCKADTNVAMQGVDLGKWKESPKYEVWQVKHSTTKFYVNPEPYENRDGKLVYEITNHKGEVFESPNLNNLVKVQSRAYPKKEQLTLFGIDNLEAFTSKHKLDKGVFYIDTTPVYDKKTKKLSHVLYTNQRGKYSPTGILISTIDLQKNFTPANAGRLSGYTATCRTWGKNRLGHRQCKTYAPTCKLPTDECRDVSAPLPHKELKMQKRTAKDTEQETIAVAQMLADEANDDLKRNKELLKDVISAGGIAPHKSGFMSEEYKYLPAKYKREKGVPMDELAQELNMTENELADKIYMAEAQFRTLKEMRGGSTTVKFKSDDFLDEAVQRMDSGRGFMGLGKIPRIQMSSLYGLPFIDEMVKKNKNFDSQGSHKMSEIREEYLLENKCTKKDIEFYNDSVIEYAHASTQSKAITLAIIVNRLNNLPDLHGFGEYQRYAYNGYLRDGTIPPITPGMVKTTKLAMEFNQDIYKRAEVPVLYRGVRGKWAEDFRKRTENKRHGIVEIDTFPFASTSARENVAIDFSTEGHVSNPKKWEKGLLFRLPSDPKKVVDSFLTHPYLDDEISYDKEKQYEVLIHSKEPITGEYFDMREFKILPPIDTLYKQLDKIPKKKEKMIEEKGGQMTLFGMSRKQLNSIMGIGD
jgi:hypothetical protein